MKAVLFAVNLETHNTMMDFFDESHSCKEGGPCLFAWELWEGIKEDWAGYQATVLGDAEACKKWGEWRMGGIDNEPHKVQ